ncbi:NtaA/DmoA family FMN-dependent monooxygenase [Pseudonocardia sp. KRD-184]|uniref:NtaA/DmoA family FMN-dependent monooxygenase n=1 Tax=Pseudonocardia oceani TaxID=2792013 RepID=A0ABS6UFF9_9PSEU|nr:NtaA/DmoA family FMN-dependent monooxygenase [Pseudonocardia oceani]MBW0088332.1 NtaA/DmoA family FMN-dependent monooxygenase [Pseudonocardia oceani]MBW0096935.1 NtaA/DmoA family FMN-dependent monooxygenase [Pseudonocardia oceani]MBW0109617.1 NtaA/DmoA family FMN-dependent monooxygenase [Pseudonocardia oceani]MBW0120342.1 NtaA/DmoA family FMN-dependent monooxygenase [Pseudonocardia oceani]MBW0130959.1 NtaA/DmoA family FMN-dependent monooxygenase [Pseudonocardia oceani]
MAKKQIHLAAHFPGVNNTTVWSDPQAGSQTDFASFVAFAQNAERGLFDFLFLAEGLRLREHQGKVHDLDVVGRPDTFTVLGAIAAVTTHLGLGGTINTTFNEPWELAKQFASLDHLSGGRAAWNLVTSSDAFTGENFRRGGFLKPEQRYDRAQQMLDAARELWLSDGAPIDHHSDQFDMVSRFPIPPTPQGHPVLIQSGDSDAGREFGARTADAIFSRHGSLESGQAFFADLKGRMGRYGRRPEDVTILPATTFALGDTEAEAQENGHRIREAQVSPQTAIAFLEQVWGRDLSAYDPDGPLPDVDPDPAAEITRGRVRHEKDPVAVANRWRELAEAKGGLSIRELIIETTARQSFVGTPKQVAQQMDAYVQADASDGFILVPHLTPGGLDEFVEKVVPELQDLGSYRTEYTGPTLRDHLGLQNPS